MKLLNELVHLLEAADPMVAGKVRTLRMQLAQVNKQLDQKKQSGIEVGDNDPLVKKAAAIQAQIDDLNGDAPVEKSTTAPKKSNELN